MASSDSEWAKMWIEMEEGEGNFGITHVINPFFYPKIVLEIRKLGRTNQTLVDFGAGTHKLFRDLFFESASSDLGLKDLGLAKGQVLELLGFEENQNLIDYFSSLELTEGLQISLVQHSVGDDTLDLPLESESVDLAFSRNFLMHLSPKALEKHVEEVFSILKSDGKYILAMLNPDYENKKHGGDLEVNKPYDFKHGKKGEHGSFSHYYRDLNEYERVFSESFFIEDRLLCRPVDETLKASYPRYYWEDVPPAIIYTLKKS